MPPPVQLKSKRSRPHIRRSGEHSGPVFRMKKCSTAAFTGAMCYEFSSVCRYSQTRLTKDGEASKITYLHNAAGQSKVIPPVRRRQTKRQTHLVEATQVRQVAVMLFAASTDPTGYRLGTDEGKYMKKGTAWVLVAIGAITSIVWWGYGQLKIDSCLDSGGRWNYEIVICDK